ncbi:response regulator [Stutzerimonas azotifigens]|uniref:Response regulator n=1 Tax=Stutzerimonas azotifigens TaxID=291995 RepID=A0ABR5YX57_9GAMM|nr:response regulator [Stutzerimonas azotifigens]MBA1272500.1 response regulator [Stutzerimonas azotifigens]
MRILLVEDDPILALTVASQLTAEGHEVAGPAYDVAEALMLAAGQEADLALVDINLAGCDEGIGLARQLRDHHGIASLFVSGQLMVARGSGDAAVGLLRKPYRPDDLNRSVLIVEALLQGREPSVPLPVALEIFDRPQPGRTGK